MKSQAPNAKQKRWRESVRSLGSIISRRTPVHIHHCAGRTAKHNKIPIGHVWILPLTEEEHREIHRDPERKAREKELFGRVLDRCWANEIPLPDEEIITAIMDYTK